MIFESLYGEFLSTVVVECWSLSQRERNGAIGSLILRLTFVYTTVHSVQVYRFRAYSAMTYINLLFECTAVSIFNEERSIF